MSANPQSSSPPNPSTLTLIWIIVFFFQILSNILENKLTLIFKINFYRIVIFLIVHHLFVDRKTPGSIDYQYIVKFSAGLFQGSERGRTVDPNFKYASNTNDHWLTDEALYQMISEE